MSPTATTGRTWRQIARGVMRPWAAERGLVEVTAVLDIDD